MLNTRKPWTPRREVPKNVLEISSESKCFEARRCSDKCCWDAPLHHAHAGVVRLAWQQRVAALEGFGCPITAVAFLLTRCCVSRVLTCKAWRSACLPSWFIRSENQWFQTVWPFHPFETVSNRWTVSTVWNGFNFWPVTEIVQQKSTSIQTDLNLSNAQHGKYGQFSDVGAWLQVVREIPSHGQVSA